MESVLGRYDTEQADLIRTYRIETRGYDGSGRASTSMLHRVVVPFVDWAEVLQRRAPLAPEFDFTNPNDVPRHLTRHKPELIEWLVGRKRPSREKLDAALEFARAQSQDTLLNQLSEYQARFDVWEEEQELAKRVLERDPKALLAGFDRFQTLTSMTLLGQQLRLSWHGDMLHAVLNLHNAQSLPMFKGETQPNIRAHVASATLKVASDIFRTLPVSELTVSCVKGVDAQNVKGDPNWAILSVQFDRDAFLALDMDTVYPVAEISRFQAVEKFSVVRGYDRITPLAEIAAN